jgi:uncharacterized protein
MIIEAIVTTLSADGEAHIAPMGVHVLEQGLYGILPFRPSRTLDNLVATGVAVINYTDDSRIFAGCLTGRRSWPLIPAQKVPCVGLAQALTWDEVRIEAVDEDPVRPQFRARMVETRQLAPFRGLNRAKMAVVEAAILVSRLGMLEAGLIDSQLAVLQSAVHKTASPHELEAWSWLMQAVAEFREKERAP